MTSRRRLCAALALGALLGPGSVAARGTVKRDAPTSPFSLARRRGPARAGVDGDDARNATETDAATGERAPLARRTVPSSGTTLPCIGMGTWITFDLPPEHPERATRVEVVRRFLAAGGGMIDSSPMYGHAEELVGHALARTHRTDAVASDDRDAVGTLFEASKIWTPIGFRGPAQLAGTERLWGRRPMALMQVHNLVAWRDHLPRLHRWRREGRIGHLGVTTSHGRRHAELEALLESEARADRTPDFVQLTYNARDREAERRLLPLARELGIAVIANRPLQRGAIPRDNARRPLPALAAELGCRSWAQLALLFVVSHPDVTCAIPATGVPAHLDENMAVGRLSMPDARTRDEIARAIG